MNTQLIEKNAALEIVHTKEIDSACVGNRQTIKQKWNSYFKHPFSFLLLLFVLAAAILTFLILLFLIGYILIKGIPYISADLFALQYNSENVSLTQSFFNTLIIMALSLLIAVPIGIASAIYLVEYAKRGNWFVTIIRLTTETLQGIPSIVYGLFGMLFFVTTLKWGYSLLAGSFTLAIMILPLIMRTTEEALKSVSDSYREGSLGLGAGRLRTVFHIVLPSAMPGILSGIILAVGRVVGESAALIYTAGTVTESSNSIMDSGRTLAIHMYMLSSEGLHTEKAYATAVILLVLVIFMNWLSGFAARRVRKKYN